MNNRNDEKKLQWFIREIERLQRERDEARAEVEQLRRERDEQIAEAASWRATAGDKGSSSRRAAKERDEARAEVERLRALLRVRGWYER